MEWLVNAVSGLVQAFNSILLHLLALLPGSPFREMVDTLDAFEFLGTLNWFIPFTDMVGMLELWTLAIGSYYAFKYAKKGLNILGVKL